MSHQGLTHAQLQQSRARRARQSGVTGLAQGQVFHLGAVPLWHTQIGEGRTGRDHVVGGAGIYPLHQSARACLYHRHQTIIEGEGPDDFQSAPQLTLLHSGQPHPRVLRQPGVDGYATVHRVTPAIHGDQFHIHEGGFAGFVEMLVRLHGVVPIQDRLSGSLRDGRFIGHDHGSGHGKPVARTSAHGDQSHNGSAHQDHLFWIHGLISSDR